MSLPSNTEFHKNCRFWYATIKQIFVFFQSTLRMYLYEQRRNVCKSENFKAEICRQLDDLYFFFTLIVFSCYSLSFQILFSVKLWRGLSLLSISKGILFIYFSNRYYPGKNIITYDIITNVIKTEHLHNMKHFQYI